MMTYAKQQQQEQQQPQQQQQHHDNNNKPPPHSTIKKAPWMISTSSNNRLLAASSGRFGSRDESTPVESRLPAKSAHLPNNADTKLPQLTSKEQKSRYSDPTLTHRPKAEYVPKLTKYRLDHPDRFQRLSDAKKSARKSQEVVVTSREGSPLRSPSKSKCDATSNVPRWQQQLNNREYGVQNAINDSKQLQNSQSQSRALLSSSQQFNRVNPNDTTTTKSAGNMNVTLMDIANLSPTAFDRSAPSKITNLLFNTFVDVQRFRKLLRESDENLTQKNVEMPEHVNFCDEEKTKRIESWLYSVEKERRKNCLCDETVDENIVYEDNSSKWNVKKW